MDYECMDDQQEQQQTTHTVEPLPGPIPLPAPPTQVAPQFGAAHVKSQIQPTSNADIEIDSLLLQQFSCLGTTDHEDLVKQFQSLMNNQMNEDSARFFLEMSNWNLQTAVGCYLDFCNFQSLPSMKIIDQNCKSAYQQAWRLQNDGTDDWPSGCYLMSPSQKQRIEIPTIKPGATCDILANLPENLPAVAVMWRLCTPNGWYFGETLWMIPPGTCDTQEDLANKMSQLRTSTIKAEDFPQASVVISVSME